MPNQPPYQDLVTAFLAEKGLTEVPRTKAAILTNGPIVGTLVTISTRGETKSECDLGFDEITGFPGRYIIRTSAENAEGLQLGARYRVNVLKIDGFMPTSMSLSQSAFAATHRAYEAPELVAAPPARKPRKPRGSGIAAKLGIDLE